MSSEGGWIGVDLDGTLAYYDGWKGIEHIGEPVPLMLASVKSWLEQGKDVRIFTARVFDDGVRDPQAAREVINAWTLRHVGRVLPVTNVKDFGMVALYDDRAWRVEENTGIVVR